MCGGPPCQGYSGIGHRRSDPAEKKDIESNHLYKQMIRVIAELKPKLFLFENVRGLISGRWTSDGEKGENMARCSKSVFVKLSGYESWMAAAIVRQRLRCPAESPAHSPRRSAKGSKPKSCCE